MKFKNYFKQSTKKNAGKWKKRIVNAALISALAFGAPSCHKNNNQDNLPKYKTHIVKKGESIWAIWNQSDKTMTLKEFQSEFIKINKGHKDIKNATIRVGETYFIPEKKEVDKLEDNDTIIDNNDKNEEQINSTKKDNYLERFRNKNSYCLAKYEQVGNKKLSEIFEKVPDPDEEIIVVESGKTLSKSKQINKEKYKNIKYITLHSTAAEQKDDLGTAKKTYAHFMVARDGKIYKITRQGGWQFLTHAGENQWNGENINNESLAIEVEAKREWSDEQYRALQKLFKWISVHINPDIKAKDVITHSQVGMKKYPNGQKTRGRKSDPYYVNWTKLQPLPDGKSPLGENGKNHFYNASEHGNVYLFPNNYTLFDYDVGTGKIDPNINAILKEYGKNASGKIVEQNVQNMIFGLRKSKQVYDASKNKQNKKEKININIDDKNSPMYRYKQLKSNYDQIQSKNKPSFEAVLAHIEQETGMYGQWNDKKFKNGKEKHFAHNNPFNITYKDKKGQKFYIKKDNVFKDGRRETMDVKFNKYESLKDGLKDYLNNIASRKPLLDSLKLGNINVKNPLVYLYKLEATGYMQGLLGNGDIDVYLTRQLNRPYNEKDPIFLITKNGTTAEIDYEINKIIKLFKKENSLKMGRNSFVFGKTEKQDGVYMTRIVFKKGGDHHLGEDRFQDNAVKTTQQQAKNNITAIKEIKKSLNI